jgi:hypothetical protein
VFLYNISLDNKITVININISSGLWAVRERERERRYSSKSSSIIGSRWHVPGNGGGGSVERGVGVFIFL